MIEQVVGGNMSRRKLLLGAAMTAMTGAYDAAAQGQGPADKLKLCVFSKVLQWTDVNEAAAIARDIGFDGIDLTVRAKGHVLPERVETDLPKAVESVRRAGLEVPMISTEITGTATPYAEAMLKTASQLGIRHYRWGGLTYKADQGVAEQLDGWKPQVRELSKLNEEYKICGMYHTHSGPGLIGGPIWDLWILFQDLDPRWTGINYDIGHATVEGGYGGWMASSRLVKNSMKGIALKDFYWPSKSKEPQWCAMGDGIVDFRGFFAIVKANHFAGPVQLHFEQAGLGGAENGTTMLRISRQTLIGAMQKDCDYAKRVMREQGLV